MLLKLDKLRSGDDTRMAKTVDKETSNIAGCFFVVITSY
jgi:hypothetical protein